MILWEKLPIYMQTESVRPYYEYLRKKKASLFMKYLFDKVVSFVLLILMSPLFLVLSVIIYFDSPGGVFYRQERVTQYGRVFCIHKFRTMVVDADKIGVHVTVRNDERVTKIGKILRKYRLDELPQLIDILLGNMSFVGTRPEVEEYVEKYTDEMYATLLLPAGITSEASIMFKDENVMLEGELDTNKAYIEKVLPEKMRHNLKSIMGFSFFSDIKIMLKTIIAVVR